MPDLTTVQMLNACNKALADAGKMAEDLADDLKMFEQMTLATHNEIDSLAKLLGVPLPDNAAPAIRLKALSKSVRTALKGYSDR